MSELVEVINEKLHFPNFHGQELAARLERASGEEPIAYALFAHCFTGSMDMAAASRISHTMATHGIAVLRFDFTGLGNSDGDFANTNFSSNIDDLVAAADFMRKQYQAPRILVGHSLGGAAVLAAATRIEECAAVVTIGAPSDPEHVRHLFEKDASMIETVGSTTVVLGGRKFQIKKQFLEDIHVHKMEAHIRALGKALLVFHSPLDSIVPIDHARRIFEHARHPKSFISLDHADHLLSHKDDAVYVGLAIASWASRYVRERAPV